MSGFGPAEGLIVLVFVLVLFGPTLVAFWLGYLLGKKKSAETPERERSLEMPSAGEADQAREAETDSLHEQVAGTTKEPEDD